MMSEGSEEEIITFLGDYKCCTEDVQLPKVDWVKVIFRYLDWSQHLIFEAFDNYAAEDWDIFKAAIKESLGCIS